MLITPESSCIDGFSGAPTTGAHDFNPWDDVAARYAPRTLYEAWRLCEFFYASDLTQRKACERVVDYFLTEPQGSGSEDAVGEKEFVQKMKSDVKILSLVRNVGVNMMVYSNVLASVILPFRRSASCLGCGTSFAVEGLLVKGTSPKVTIEDKNIYLDCKCAKCRSKTRWAVQDFADKNIKNVSVKVWDPKRISIQQNFFGPGHRFWYDPHPAIRRAVKNMDAFAWATVPRSIIIGCMQDKQVCLNSRLTRFFSETQISGIDLGGWAPPVTLAAFRRLFRLQVLNNHDEALAISFSRPLRLLSPDARGASDNTVVMQNMKSIMDNMDSILEHHQDDGLSWYFSPFPMQYQSMGGEARSLSPKELIQDEEDRLLAGRGVPPEFYRGNMTIQAAPVSLRLFERNQQPLVDCLNDATEWISSILSSYIGSGDYSVTLGSVTIIDDIQGREWKQQAAAAGQISMQTAVAGTGIDMDEERERVLSEQERAAVSQRKFEERMALAQQSLVADAQMAAGGQPGAQGGAQQEGSPPIQDLQAEAVSKAEQLLSPEIDDATRRRQLRAIEQSNELLHAAVLKEMDKIRTKGRAVGQQQGVQAVISGQA